MSFKVVLDPLLWIRIGLNADPDPDPVSYFIADPDPDPESYINQCGSVSGCGSRSGCVSRSGSGSWSDLKLQQVVFFMNNVLIGQKTDLQRYGSLFEKQETRFSCYYWSISMLLDPDPHSQCRSGSTKLVGSSIV